jgi:hypothetical protein
MNLTTLRDTPPWDWPADAASHLLDALRDERTKQADCLLAAELAGDFVVVNDEIVAALLSILQNPDASEVLRCQAAISLGPALESADMDGFDGSGDAPIGERTFRRMQESLHTLYGNGTLPDNVRRSVLEASVRAPQDWHAEAIRAAYTSDDQDWKLTAVFSMTSVAGFEEQILEALKSPNTELRLHAVRAAGNWEIDAAWSDVKALVTSSHTDSALLLCAIEALAGIRPDEAPLILFDLTDSPDEDIAEAAREAIAMAEARSASEDSEE